MEIILTRSYKMLHIGTILKILVGVFVLGNFSYGQDQESVKKITKISFSPRPRQNTIYCSFQDHQGFFWFGTGDGLYKYDGYAYKRYAYNPKDLKSLRDNLVFSLTEDKNHNLWVGTLRGLDKFDRKTESFTHFLTPAAFNGYDKKYNIQRLIPDSLGNLWIGTLEGICYFDYQKNSFTYFPPQKMQNGDLGALYKSKDNKILVGTSYSGLFIFDPKNRNYQRIYKNNKSNIDFSDYNIKTICEDKNGLLWIGTSNVGLKRWNPKNGEIMSFAHNPQDLNSISSNNISSLHFDKLDSNILWIGSLDGGLNKLNLKNLRIERYSYKETDPLSLPSGPLSLTSNQVLSIYEDKAGCIWLGTTKGINRIEKKAKQFNVISDQKIISLLLQDKVFKERIQKAKANPMGSFEFAYRGKKDKEGNLWFTFGIYPERWLIKYKPESNQLKIHTINSNDPNNLGMDSIKEIDIDAKGNIWLGTRNGINVIENNTGIVHKYSTKPSSPIQLVTPNINFLKSFDTGDVWVGYNRGEISKIANNKIEHFNIYDKISNIAPSAINDIYPIGKDSLLIATYSSGLYFFNHLTGELKQFLETGNDENSLHSNNIRFFYKDRKGRIWVSTNEGLHRLDLKNEKIYYYKNEIASSPEINNLLEDKYGNLWSFNYYEIIKFNPENKDFTLYDYRDGTQNYFHEQMGRCFKGIDGVFYFGGSGGITYFSPNSIEKNSYIPHLAITEFNLHNKTVNRLSSSPLKENISQTEEIVLNHTQNTFGFTFAALNYIENSLNSYAFKLEGFEKDWNYVGQKRAASYTNIEPGEYVFRVKGSNNDVIWNEQGKSIKIIIEPPFWKTWWFKLLEGVVAISLILGFNYLRVRNIKKTNKILEKTVKERTSELFIQKEELKVQSENLTEINKILSERNEDVLKQNEEIEHQKNELSILNSTKDKFFSIIAHDLRNPFSAIIGVTEILISDFKNLTDEEKIDFIYTLKNSSENVYNLLQNLLEWARTQTGSLTVKREDFVVNDLIDECVQLLKLNLEKKEIKLGCMSAMHKVKADRNMLSVVITNILTNAVKFTPNNGIINIETQQVGGFVKIAISDSGIGMDETAINNLFRIDESYSSKGTGGEIGSGLGLIICKEFVEKNFGKIFVKSEKGKGSTFFIVIPDGDATDIPIELTFESKRVVSTSKLKEVARDQNIEKMVEVLGDPMEDKAVIDDNEKKILLVADDDEILRMTIKNFFSKQFIVYEAENGKEAYELATQIIPDIVISDVTMPVENGISFSYKLKNDERTSHIPVVLLTGNTLDESKIEGLESGADDYITKPVTLRVLKARIVNLISIRKKLQEVFKKRLLGPVETTIDSEASKPSKGDAFIERALEIIDENISNATFNVDELVKQMGMSRSVLYRKFMSITGIPVGDFIRNIKLKKASELLLTSDMNVNEVAFSVGFEDPSYFSRAFKKQFGETPTNYVEKNKANNNSVI